MSVQLPPIFCATRANTTTVYKPQERNKSGFCFSTPLLCQARVYDANTQNAAVKNKKDDVNRENAIDSSTAYEDERYEDVNNEYEKFTCYESNNSNITTVDDLQVNYAQHKLWLHETPLPLCNYSDKEVERIANNKTIEMVMTTTKKITPNESDASCKLFRPSLPNQMAGLSRRRKGLKRNYSQLHSKLALIENTTELNSERKIIDRIADCTNEDHRMSTSRTCLRIQNTSDESVDFAEDNVARKSINVVNNDKIEEIEYDNIDSKEAVRLLFAMRANQGSAVEENKNNKNDSSNEEEIHTEVNERKVDGEEESERTLCKLMNANNMANANCKLVESIAATSSENTLEMTMSTFDASNVEWLPSAYDTLVRGLARDNMNSYCRPHFANNMQDGKNHNLYNNNKHVSSSNNNNIYVNSNRSECMPCHPSQESCTLYDECDSGMENSFERKLCWLQYAEQDERLIILLLEFEQNVTPLYTTSLPCCLEHDESCVKFMERVLHLRSPSEMTTKLHSIESLAYNEINHTSERALELACKHVTEESSQYLSHVLIRKARHEKELIWHKHGMLFYETLTQMRMLELQESKERFVLVCQWNGCNIADKLMMQEEKKGEEIHCLDCGNNFTFYQAVILNNCNELYSEELAEHDTFIETSILYTSILCEQDKLRNELVQDEKKLRKCLYDYHEYCIQLWRDNTTRVDVNTPYNNKENFKEVDEISNCKTAKNRPNMYVKCGEDSPICSYLSYRLVRLREETALQLAEEHIMKWEEEEWQSIRHIEQNERECILLWEKCITEKERELCVEEQNEWHTLLTLYKARLADIVQCEEEKQRKEAYDIMQERIKEEIEMFVINTYQSKQQLSEQLLQENEECQRASRLEIKQQILRELEMQFTESGIVQQWLLERRASEIVNDEIRLRYKIYCENEKELMKLHELNLWQRDEWYREHYLQLVKDEQNEFAQIVFISEEVKCRQAIAKVEHDEYNAFYMPQLVTCKLTSTDVTNAPTLNLRHYILADLNDFMSVNNLHILFSMSNTC